MFFICSFGFGIEYEEDIIVSNSDGIRRKLFCGIEKGKYKCKNY